MAVVNEHPNSNVRKLYAGQVAAQVGLPVADLVQLAERGVRRPQVHVSAARVAPRAARERRVRGDHAARPGLGLDRPVVGRVAVRRRVVPPGVPRHRRCRRRPGGRSSAGRSRGARRARTGGCRRPRRSSAEVEARNLIAAAVRRELGRTASTNDPALELDDREARLRLEDLGVQEHAADAAELVASLAGGPNGRTLMGGADALDSTVVPPLGGVDREEWQRLVVRGRVVGELPAEDITHVLRSVELTSDALLVVQAALTAEGILIDEEIDEIASTRRPVGMSREVVIDDEDAERLLSRRRRRRGAKKIAPRVDTGTADGVRMYLREIGQVDLLDGRRRAASGAADRGGPPRRRADRRGRRPIPPSCRLHDACRRSAASAPRAS